METVMELEPTLPAASVARAVSVWTPSGTAVVSHGIPDCKSVGTPSISNRTGMNCGTSSKANASSATVPLRSEPSTGFWIWICGGVTSSTVTEAGTVLHSYRPHTSTRRVVAPARPQGGVVTVTLAGASPLMRNEGDTVAPIQSSTGSKRTFTERGWEGPRTVAVARLIVADPPWPKLTCSGAREAEKLTVEGFCCTRTGTGPLEPMFPAASYARAS